jgi:hypothetical protein
MLTGLDNKLLSSGLASIARGASPGDAPIKMNLPSRVAANSHGS